MHGNGYVFSVGLGIINSNGAIEGKWRGIGLPNTIYGVSSTGDSQISYFDTSSSKVPICAIVF